jgi:desulfoferrodoxin (superoxide reductase-like protein)
VFEREKYAVGHKWSKEHLTFMCCGNSSKNHKLKFVVNGKAKKTLLFKGTESNCISVHYCNQKGMWMDREIF